MLGQIELEKFDGLTRLPQEAASAWAVMSDLCGAIFKPILYVGKQQVNGVNHWFIAEETQITLDGERRLVMLAINENNVDGEATYTLISQSIVVLT